MIILKNIDELQTFLQESENVSCLADTNFLFGLVYKDDRLFEKANDAHDMLCEYEVPIFSNVISRMEFIDLIFRKQVTDGCVQIFNNASAHSYEKHIYKILKDIRDKDTAGRRKNEIYKVDEWRLKQLRKYFQDDYGLRDWKQFCANYVGQKLTNEWIAIEEDLGLNFIEIMEGQISSIFSEPVKWADMVQLMGEHGIRGPDAMIVNLFKKSKIQLLITNDSDFETCFTDPLDNLTNKAIFIL